VNGAARTFEGLAAVLLALRPSSKASQPENHSPMTRHPPVRLWVDDFDTSCPSGAMTIMWSNTASG